MVGTGREDSGREDGDVLLAGVGLDVVTGDFTALLPFEIIWDSFPPLAAFLRWIMQSLRHPCFVWCLFGIEGIG